LGTVSAEKSKIPATLKPDFAFARDPAVEKVVRALDAARPGGARFVGGCVRDSLLGLAPKDVDIATPLPPDAVIAALHAAGLAAAPTGIEHGTVTAIADHKGVEVTTLRADVSTDGRRASVAFTEDWIVDAQRRDFTINALYLSPELDFYDPTGGADDLVARRVRFIGAAEDRIREDYLRILRFFRFSARFAETFDKAGLSACAALKAGIARLSAERIGDEFMKLLALPAPQASISAMAASGVLREVWPAPPSIETLARMKSIDPDAASPIALAALFGEAGDGIDGRLRLSNAQAERRRDSVANATTISPSLSERDGRALLYRMGADGWRDACLLAEARALAASEAPDRRNGAIAGLGAVADRWTAPTNPFTGKAALALGVPAGPRVAALIKAAEARWIDEDFPGEDRARAIFAEEAARITSKG
jgi:poly(A) polymerase